MSRLSTNCPVTTEIESLDKVIHEESVRLEFGLQMSERRIGIEYGK